MSELQLEQPRVGISIRICNRKVDRQEKTDAWVSTGHEYAADAVEFTVVKLKFRQIWFD